MKSRDTSQKDKKKNQIENEYFERKKRKNSFKIELINTFGDNKSPWIPYHKANEMDDF
jgi:hypothetical protein